MKNRKPKGRMRSFISWVLWVLLVQLILINISAALYAHKLTHLQPAAADTFQTPASRNIFAKTWRLFSGPVFYSQSLAQKPVFSFESIQLKTEKYISIECWYGRADSSAKGTVILMHGYSSNKGQVLDEATAFRNWGYHVMLIDTRNHGNSGGRITTVGYKESEEVKLAYDHIKQRGEKNVFLWGTSMGAVAIMKAISEYKLEPSGIIIEMPYLSLQSHLKGRARTLGFPVQPFGFLTTFWIGVERGFNGLGFQMTRYARNIHCPVLQQYGEKDEWVLKSETEAIFNSIASGDKNLVAYQDALHESFLRKDPAVWRREVESFLEKASTPIF